ncbi:MAG: response regulator [Phycisphaerae bacterium]|nr:response regulator [Phycisphaerae bacterium]MCZ2401294.1 response regulator [Phycisphaerae bacterium]
MRGNGQHIVLIDDDADVHHAVRLMLEPEGYRVTCCSTGPEGLEVIRRERPDLVLLDVMLASPSEGFHLAYELKADDVLRHIPIVMISAIGQRVGLDYARELGTDYVKAEAFIDKPFDAARLRAVVREQISRARKEQAP